MPYVIRTLGVFTACFSSRMIAFVTPLSPPYNRYYNSSPSLQTFRRAAVSLLPLLCRFHLVPYETGKYRFCLRLNQEKTGSRYVLSREVLWDLHVGHSEHHEENVKEHDTQARHLRRWRGSSGKEGLAAGLLKVLMHPLCQPLMQSFQPPSSQCGNRA